MRLAPPARAGQPRAERTRGARRWAATLSLVVIRTLPACQPIAELPYSTCEWHTGVDCPSLPERCVANGPLPDPSCTPGALNPDVSAATTDQTICTSGWTRTVRPPLSYTAPIKRALMEAYTVGDDTSRFQLDHLVPLELGGAPADVRNLWPLRHEPAPGSQEKDGLANQLKARVCAGDLSLADAQLAIAFDWVSSWELAGAPQGGF